MDKRLEERKVLVERVKLLAFHVCNEKVGGQDLIRAVEELVRFYDAFEELTLGVAHAECAREAETAAAKARLETVLATLKKTQSSETGSAAAEGDEKQEEEEEEEVEPEVEEEEEDIDAADWFHQI